MVRGKAAIARKDHGLEPAMVGRRAPMEHIYPHASIPTKRAHPEHHFHVNGQAPMQKPLHLRIAAPRQSPYKRPRTTLATPWPSKTSKRQGRINGHTTTRVPMPMPVSVPASAPAPAATVPRTPMASGSTHADLPPAYPHPSGPTLPNLLYAPLRALDVDKVFAQAGNARSVLARIHVPAEYLTASNPAIKARHLWGHKRYTDDSDLVAVLLHTGFHKPSLHVPSALQFLSVLVELTRHVSGVSPPFAMEMVNALASREWSAHYEGAALRVVSVAAINCDVATLPPTRLLPDKCLRTPRLVPWQPVESAAPAASAAAASSRDGKAAAKRSPLDAEAGIMAFDLLCEPCLVFDVTELVALGKGNAMVGRLRRDVMYVENERERYEISLVEMDDDDHAIVRFARVSNNTMTRLRVQRALSDVAEDGEKSATPSTLPLRTKQLNVIGKRVAWSKLAWDSEGVTLNGKRYHLTKMSFRERTRLFSH